VIELRLEQNNRIFTDPMTKKKPLSQSALKRMITTLENAHISFDKNDENSIRTGYSQFMSNSTKRAYPMWLASNTARTETFSERSLRGVRNRGRRIGGQSLSDDEAYELGISALGGVKRSDEIKQGLRKAYGDQAAISENFRQRHAKQVADRLNKDVSELTSNDYRDYQRSIGFYNRDVFSWKKKQAETFAGTQLNDDEVEIKYSEYLSQRFKRSALEVSTNGWKSTLKGWFQFKSHDLKMFYRSSWELAVFQELDELYAAGVVLNVCVPERIKFEFKGLVRHYYPDVQWSTVNGTWIGEVKPSTMLDDELNVAKFAAANNVHGDKFVVITEISLQDLRRVLHV
jgi:hypothetical protein